MPETHPARFSIASVDPPSEFSSVNLPLIKCRSLIYYVYVAYFRNIDWQMWQSQSVGYHFLILFLKIVQVEEVLISSGIISHTFEIKKFSDSDRI